MRVLLQTWGSRGDVEPMVALAAQLTRAGAEVRVCAPPDREVTDRLAAAGAEHVPFGQSVRELVAGPRPLTSKAAPTVAEALVNEFFDTALPAAEGCGAVVVSGLMPSGGRSVAEVVGARYVCAMFQPLGLPSPDHRPGPRPGIPFPPGADLETMWRIDAERVNALYRAPLNRRRAEFGRPPVENVRDHVFGEQPWLATDPLLDDYPRTAVDLWQTGAWFVPDDRPLPPEIMRFLDAGTPPVYVGFGSMPMREAGEAVVRLTLEALRARGRRAVLSGGWAGLAATDAPDCLVVGEVNHQALFPRTAAVVHHGGAGTTHAAARAGAPQVIVPQIVDQPYWGGRIERLGLGAVLAGPEEGGRVPTAEALAVALDTALAEDTRSRASGTAGAIRSDGAAVAARRLLGEAR